MKFISRRLRYFLNKFLIYIVGLILINILIFVYLIFLRNKECYVENECMWIGKTGKFCDRKNSKCKDFGV
jgi:energy-converting hydrogenase Eha subunit H